MVPLKYLSNIWRSLEMSSTYWEVNLILTWFANCVMVYNDIATFAMTETKLYVPVVTLSTQDNAKLLRQLKSGFNRTINQKKYLIKPELLRRNPNFNYLVEPSLQRVNRLFLAFEKNAQRASNRRYYLQNVEIKDYNIMIDGKNSFGQPIKNNKITYENIRKMATGQGNDYPTGCLLDYSSFKENYKMIAIDISKKQSLDADLKAIQQINFGANLDRAENIGIYFILEEAKETVLDFS